MSSHSKQGDALFDERWRSSARRLGPRTREPRRLPTITRDSGAVSDWERLRWAWQRLRAPLIPGRL